MVKSAKWDLESLRKHKKHLKKGVKEQQMLQEGTGSHEKAKNWHL